MYNAGWGKSLVYFIATKLLRQLGASPALLISPLLALMRNQIIAASTAGLLAESIDSTNQDQWPDIEDRFLGEKLDIVPISPERLGNG